MGEDTGRDGSGRHLDHASDLDFWIVCGAFGSQFLHAVADQGQALRQLRTVGEHRQHDVDGPVRGGAQDRTQLCHEDRLILQGPPDCTQAEGRVRRDRAFVVRVEFLVGTQVQGADGQRLAVQRNDQISIHLVLFVGAGAFGAVEVEELGAVQPDAFRLDLVDMRNLFDQVDVAFQRN